MILGNKRRHPNHIDSSDEDSFVKPDQIKPRVFSKIKKKQPGIFSFYKYEKRITEKNTSFR